MLERKPGSGGNEVFIAIPSQRRRHGALINALTKRVLPYRASKIGINIYGPGKGYPITAKNLETCIYSELYEQLITDVT